MDADTRKTPLFGSTQATRSRLRDLAETNERAFDGFDRMHKALIGKSRADQVPVRSPAPAMGWGATTNSTHSSASPWLVFPPLKKVGAVGSLPGGVDERFYYRYDADSERLDIGRHPRRPHSRT